MTQFFLTVLNMSISAGYVVLVVLLLRLLLKCAPRWISVLLWGIVAVRLICPVSVESVLSLIPSAETVSPDIMFDAVPSVNTGIPIVNNALNPILEESFAPSVGDSANPLQILLPILAAVWCAGMAVMVIYTVISYLRLQRKVRTAVRLRDNIYQSEAVVSPFVLGILRPRIYLPFGLSEQDAALVIAHEQAHVKRRDHWWKPLGFLLLTLHWFNPLLWLGYVLLCRDIELACDEKVIRSLDHARRADYSQALLTCSVNRRMIAACPLAFGEVGVKNRVKTVLNYRKPAFWIILAAIVACIALAVCFLTNPPSDVPPDAPPVVDLAVETEYPGIYLTIDKIEINSSGNMIFRTTWHNSTDKQAMYGNPFGIQYKGNNGWEAVDKTEDRVFTTEGILLHPNSDRSKIYNADYYDLSRAGTYRLIASFSVMREDGNYKTWAQFTVGAESSEAELRALVPQYFDLDASEGLDVYVWQFAKEHYGFGLLPHSDEHKNGIASELLNLKGCSLGAMRTILATYDLDPAEIHVIPWQNPLSSYMGDLWVFYAGEDHEAERQAYVQNVRNMLFGPYSPVVYTPTVSSSLVYAAPPYSFILSKIPRISIREDRAYDFDTGEFLGDLTPVYLDKTDFLELMGEFGSRYAEQGQGIALSNQYAYAVTPPADTAGSIDLYYILIQNDGSLLTVYGHYKDGRRDDLIRWIFRTATSGT